MRNTQLAHLRHFNSTRKLPNTPEDVLISRKKRPLQIISTSSQYDKLVKSNVDLSTRSTRISQIDAILIRFGVKFYKNDVLRSARLFLPFKVSAYSAEMLASTNYSLEKKRWTQWNNVKLARIIANAESTSEAISKAIVEFPFYNQRLILERAVRLYELFETDSETFIQTYLSEKNRSREEIKARVVEATRMFGSENFKLIREALPTLKASDVRFFLACLKAAKQPPEVKSSRLTDEELNNLFRGVVTHHRSMDWNKVQQEFAPARTGSSLYVAWVRNQPGYSNAKWTEEEDQLLISLVKKFGHRWKFISLNYMPHRSQVAIYTRWGKAIEPHLNSKPWTPEEDKILLDAQKKLGNKWATIVRDYLPSRSQHGVLMRFKKLGCYVGVQWTRETLRKLYVELKKSNGKLAGVAKKFGIAQQHLREKLWSRGVGLKVEEHSVEEFIEAMLPIRRSSDLYIVIKILKFYKKYNSRMRTARTTKRSYGTVCRWIGRANACGDINRDDPDELGRKTLVATKLYGDFLQEAMDNKTKLNLSI